MMITKIDLINRQGQKVRPPGNSLGIKGVRFIKWSGLQESLKASDKLHIAHFDKRSCKHSTWLLLVQFLTVRCAKNIVSKSCDTDNYKTGLQSTGSYTSCRVVIA